MARAFDEAKEICRYLTVSGYPTMLAGGCVRDHLLNREPADYDLAGKAHPEKAGELLAARGYKVIPVGLKHGTIGVVTPVQMIEYTTLRRDISCDGRHAEISFADDFAEDAQRRDFSINALYMDCEGVVHDHVDGIADLKARRLRFVGSAENRIREDFLRSLRFFRFLARFGWPIDADQLKAIQAEREGLKRLSAERVQAELHKFFNGAFAAETLPDLVRSGIPHTLFPWFKDDRIDEMAAALARYDGSDETVFWFLWFYLGGLPVEVEAQWNRACRDLRLSNQTKRGIKGLHAFFAKIDRPLEALAAILRFAERDQTARQAVRFLVYELEHLRREHSHPAYSSLITGLERRDAPVFPKEVILEIAAAERGRALAEAKICWYLGLSDDKSQLAGILTQAHQRQTLLRQAEVIE